MNERRAGPPRIDRQTGMSVKRVGRVVRLWASALGFMSGALFATVPSGACSDAASPAPTDIEALMAFFAEAGAVHASFESTQTISILSSPLESAGELYFEPPDRMVRHTTRPGRSKVVVEGTRVALLDETGLREMDLAASGAARGLVEDVMLVLRGDLPALRQRYLSDYRVEEAGADGAAWTLSLDPRDASVKRLVKEIVFVGCGRDLESMITREANGDATIMRLRDVVFGDQISERDRAALFSLEPSKRSQ